MKLNNLGFFFSAVLFVSSVSASAMDFKGKVMSCTLQYHTYLGKHKQFQKPIEIDMEKTYEGSVPFYEENFTSRDFDGRLHLMIWPVCANQADPHSIYQMAFYMSHMPRGRDAKGHKWSEADARTPLVDGGKSELTLFSQGHELESAFLNCEIKTKGSKAGH
jgi:hypothetical protein